MRSPRSLLLFLWRTCTFPPKLTQAKLSIKVPRSAPLRPSESERLVLAIAKDESCSKEERPKPNSTQAAHPQRAERTGFCLYDLRIAYSYRLLPPSATQPILLSECLLAKPMKAVYGTWQPTQAQEPRQPPDKQTVNVDKMRG